MKKLFYLALLVFLASSATATTISSQNVSIDLETSEVEVEMRVAELTSSTFTYITSHPIEDVDVEAGGQTLECETVSLQVGSEISCDTDLRKNFTAQIEFTGSDFTSWRDNVRVFSYSQSIYRPTNNYRLRVILPEGTGLVDQKNASTPVVSPSDYTTQSNGRRISIQWKKSPQIGDTLRFTVMYESFSRSTDYTRLIVLAAVLMLLSAVGYITWKKKNRDDIEEVYEELSEDEIEVVELLRENDGEMLQKDVVDASSYSKAKISGVVSGLVDKGVIDKTKEGRSNKLRISKNFSH